MKRLFGAPLLALVMGLSGCYGSFNMTRDLYRWQAGVRGKWYREGAFLLTSLGYVMTAFGDTVVFNSVEFWTGKDPLPFRSVRSVESDGKQAVMSYAPAEHRMRVDTFERGRLTATVIVRQGVDGMEARDAQGRLLLRAQSVDGDVVVSDASGRPIREYDASRQP